MNKNKGFTLIELLGTIVIIGILGTVAITSVVNIKKSSNNRFDNSQVELMKQAGQTYFTDNKRLLPIVEGQTNYVTLDKLIEKGYINKLYNSKKEEFDPTTSYAWVQKQNDGSYKYDCYCEIKGEKLAGTTAIPESKVNTSTITFKYNGNFYEKEDNNKKTHYTNGKGDAVVEVSLIRDEVSTYKYEIFKKNYTNDKNEYNQYKVSQRDKLTADTIDIKLKAAEYSEGEYYIRVTTYNESGNHNQSVYSDAIYVDKTPPTCNITTDYKIDESSKQSLWYNSKSKNSSNQALGIDQELPIVASGSDEGSGVNESTKHIFSDRSHFNKLDNDNGTYNAGNTGKNGKEYYATIEDNVGNKASCSQLYYIDTTPPTCSDKGIKTGTKGNKAGNKQWYLTNVQTYGYFTDENSGITDEEQLSDILKNTKKDAQTSTITRKDNAGNEGSCVITDIYIDKENPTCTSSGGSNTWKNATSNKETTLKGTCSDVGSGCVAGIEAGKRYDSNGNVYWDITWEGSWNNRSPGTVYDEAGNSTTCPGNQTIKHDWTAPTCSISLSDSNKGNKVEGRQWYRGDVTASLSITDGTTGSPGTVKSKVTPTMDGNEQKTTIKKTDSGQYTLNGEVTDAAGNSTTCQSANFGIDKTKPTCPTSTVSSYGGEKVIAQTWRQIPVIVNITNTNSDTYSGVDYWEWYVKDTASNNYVQDAFYFQEKNKGDKEYRLGLGQNYEGKLAGRIKIYDNAGNYSQCDTSEYWIDHNPPNCPESSITESFVMPNGKTPETDVWTNLPIKVSIPALNLDSGKGSNVYWNWTVKDKDNKTLSDLSKSKQTSTNEMTKIIGDSPKEYEGKMTGIFEMKDEAGNVSKCYNKTFLIDRKKPNCETTGNSDNWVNTNVTLTGTCSDSGSECSDDTKTITKTIDNETNADYTPGSVSDKAGNSKTCNKVRVKIDKTAPSCNPGGNVPGWTNSNLNLTGTCSDSLSGCNPQKTYITKEVTTEISDDNYIFGSVEDNAGNISNCSISVHTDYTAPTCPTITSSTKNENWTKDTVNIGITNTNQDNLSGVNYWKWYTDYNDGNWNEKSTNNGDGTKTLEAEGKRRGLVAIYDHAGNHSDCMTLTYYIDKTAPTITGTCLFNQTGSNGLYPKGFWCQEPGSSIEHVYHGGWIYVQDNYVNVGSISNLKVSSGSLTRDSRTGNASGNRFCISTGSTDTSGANVTLSGNFCDSLGNCQDLSTTLSNHIGTGFPNYNNKCSGNADSNGDPICDCKYLRTDHKWTG